MKALQTLPALSCLFLLTAALLAPFHSFPQACLNLQEKADIASTCSTISMTMEHDQQGQPFLYVANKEAGLRVYNISNIQSPALVKEIGTDMMEGLEAMNLSQSGNYLYLALGNFFAGDQSPGLAIIDVAEPANAGIKDVWVFPTPTQGAGIVEVEGDYAYLGAMGHGLVILDVSDKENIEFVASYTPDITFPGPNPDPAKYNARGIAVKDNFVYLCYDAGGIRIIDVSDKQQPVEIGRYSNPALNARPRAYNNALLHENLLYVTFDYCGLEILDVSNPENIAPISWWNPWNCQSNPLNWFSSPGHTNELALDEGCGLLFLSSGKSDLHILDVSNPGQPDSCGHFGGIDNGIGTWGVARYDDKVFFSYICSIIPFASTSTGIKILSYDAPCVSDLPEAKSTRFSIFPNPATSTLTVHWQQGAFKAGKLDLQVFSLPGQLIARRQLRNSDQNYQLDVKAFPTGIYWLTLSDGQAFSIQKAMVD
ncbi:MAG: T9SS type A sorting domain-containing protein [Lewinellaceae bacterium]|nr:T9SS type A sorting domain-containing protein [Lewinellaceae bacterium]